MSSPIWSWQHAILKSDLESSTKLVCLTIGCHLAADGSGCFPSTLTVAKESGLARSTAVLHIQKAVAAGYLESESRHRENGSQTSNIYRPRIPEGGVRLPDRGGTTTGQGGVRLPDTNYSLLTAQLIKKGKVSKNPFNKKPREGEVTITDFIKSQPLDGSIPKLWVEAGRGRGLNDLQTIRQAHKCVWYFTKGNGAGTVGTPDWWQRQAWKFLQPKNLSVGLTR